MSRTTGERERFRNEQLDKIENDESIKVLPLDEAPRYVLHIIPHSPLESFDLGPFNLPIFELENEITNVPATLMPFLPIIDSHNRQLGGGFNDDGLLVYVRANYDVKYGNPVETIEPKKRSAYSYLQVFSDGSIEVVRASYFRGGHKLINVIYESNFLEALPRYLRIQEEVGVVPPISVYFTLSGVLNAQFSDNSQNVLSGPFSTDRFYAPEIVVEGFEPDDVNKLVEGLKEAFQQARDKAGPL
jgi:hypothetical protein